MDTYTVIIDDLAFQQGTGTAPFYWTGKIAGFGKGDIRTSSKLNSGAGGGYIGDQLLGFRRIPLSLSVHSKDLAEVEDAAMQINTKFRPGADLTVRLITPTGKEFVIPKARVIHNEPEIGDIVTLIDYQVELLSGDPAIYDYTSGAASRIELEKIQSGGIEWSDGMLWTTSGVVWTDSAGDKQVNNLGNTDVFPIITITGAVTNPQFLNRANNRVLSVNVTTAPSDVIKIDFLNQEITLNGINIYNNLDEDDFWPIQPGSNTIIYTSDSNDDEAVIELEWFNGYSGVM